MSQRIDGLDEGENPHVAVGRDGWLFLRRGTNDVAAQISGRFPLPADFDEQWRRLLERRRDYCDSIGAQYLFFVAPNKECVHSDLLPPDMRVVEDRPVARVLSAAAGLVPAVYPIAEFRRAAGRQPLYALQDSHWRREGLVLAYRIIMRHLGWRPWTTRISSRSTGR